MKKFLTGFLAAFFLVGSALLACAYLRSTGALSFAPDWEEMTAAELTDYGSPYKYYYRQLSNNEKLAYNAILSEIEAMPESIEIPSLTQNELNSVFSAVLYDNPQLFFVGSNCKITSVGSRCYYSADYTMSPEKYAASLERVQSAAEKIISSLTDPSDEWLTELEVHNAIIDSCDYLYVEDSVVSTVYGALCENEASCEGYSKAMKYILDSVGIESYVLAGTGTNRNGETESHMWNIVSINGVYSHLDVTWDDPVGSDSVTYTYFNLTDSQINSDHSEWNFGYDCLSNAQSYYIVEGLYFDTFGQKQANELASRLADALNSGEKRIEIKLADKEAFDGAVEYLIEDNGIYRVLSSAAKQTDVEFSHSSLSYLEDDVMFVITIIPKLN